MKEYLTIAELSKQVDVPNSTCRRYLSTFEAFFIVKGGNRLKKYESQALDVLKRIKALYHEGLESSEIYNVLVKEFPLVIDGDEQQGTGEISNIPTLATVEDIESIHQKLDKLDDIVRELDKVKALNQNLVERMEQQNEYINKSLERRDQRIIEAIQDMQEQKQQAELEMASTTNEQHETERKLGFFARLFSK